jgi:hypothetical protein
MTGSKGSAQTELTGQHGGGNDARQLAGILTGGGWVSTADTQKVQHGSLAFKDGTTTNGADLDGRHRHSDLEVAVVAVMSLVSLA